MNSSCILKQRTEVVAFGELLALLVVLVLVMLVLALEELGFLCDAGSLVARVGEKWRAGGWEPRLTEH